MLAARFRQRAPDRGLSVLDRGRGPHLPDRSGGLRRRDPGAQGCPRGLPPRLRGRRRGDRRDDGRARRGSAAVDADPATAPEAADAA